MPQSAIRQYPCMDLESSNPPLAIGALSTFDLIHPVFEFDLINYID